MEKTKCEQCNIRQLNALRGMTPSELNSISELKEVQTLTKGKVIFGEGRKINGIYCIRSGTTKISKRSINGNEQVLRLASRGDLLGKNSLINGGHSEVSVTAIDDVRLCFIPKTAVLDILMKNNHFSLELLKKFAQELKESDDKLLTLSQLSSKQRMAHIILFLREFGEDKEGFLRLQLSRDDIGSMAGIVAESAIRILASFKKESWIKISRRRLGIINIDALKHMANGY